jgi:hypothetical protein
MSFTLYGTCDDIFRFEKFFKIFNSREKIPATLDSFASLSKLQKCKIVFWGCKLIITIFRKIIFQIENYKSTKKIMLVHKRAMNRNLIIPHSAVNYKISLLLKSFHCKMNHGKWRIFILHEILKWLVLWQNSFSRVTSHSQLELSFIFSHNKCIKFLIFLVKSMRSQSSLNYSSCLEIHFNDMMTLMDMVKFEENEY